jgi:hypothetical protein
MACELCVSGLRYLTTEYPRIPPLTGLSAIAKAIPLLELPRLQARGYFRSGGVSWMNIARWKGGSQVL